MDKNISLIISSVALVLVITLIEILLIYALKV